ncbi:dienelactone hydrolase family protein [Aquabacterium humicola]|uniref:dienelactone hydrolase family protein n=1 Tax=Aquabacterium humicola TaxID=3237377 RepID=UPI0025438BEE|nr:dienelactone hydrolase family protein [Rubrivivax pictus]
MTQLLRRSASLVTCLLSLSSPAIVGARHAGYEPDLKTQLVVYPLPGTKLSGVGRLQVPTDLSSAEATRASAATKVPAVVIVHGTGGMDAKGIMYARALNSAGIATLEVDLWSPRGLSGGWDGRPKHVRENLPDAFGALAFLAAHPRIDGRRVGIMGFSWGGVLSMLAADEASAAEHAQAGQRFAAHMPFYPICFAYNRIPGYPFRELTGAPIYILTGANDRYDVDPRACDKLADSLPDKHRPHVRVKVYDGAEHGFNNLDRPRRYLDPYHDQGKGGEGGSTPLPAARQDSVSEAASFFGRTLKVAP